MPTARILDSGDDAAIAEAAAAVRAGGIVAFPTETVYGLGADACNPLAVARVFEVKRRPEFDPIIVHVGDVESARASGDVSGELAQRLIRRFWPGPLTLVVAKTSLVPPIVTAGLDTVAVRMPA
ncbi:MAG: L-threonylcarbamoyladenylate synthase, partial [Acidobacteriota bacterium]